MATFRWGVLSTAKIATTKVIPAIELAAGCEVTAIASRSPGKAQVAADALGIARAYDSYDALLNDPEIDIIYNPLPNHMHVEWTLKAMAAGKHVLCEKPISDNSADVLRLMQAQKDTGVTVGEAFMIKAAPQWRKVLEMVKQRALGDIHAVQGSFFYRNLDSGDIRNRAESLGGAMMDIGCYPVTVARMVFGGEPDEVVAIMDKDENFQTDRLSSAVMRFGNAQCTFTVGTQTAAFQRVFIFASERHLEVRIPFNAPNDRATELYVHTGDPLEKNSEIITFPVNDQFTEQAENFVSAIQNKAPLLTPLADAWGNAATIEALFKSASTRSWQQPAARPTL